MCRSRREKLLKRRGRVCCEGFEIVAETCPNVFCDPALQESPWELQLQLAIRQQTTAQDRLEMAQGDLKKAKAKKNAKKEVQAAEKKVEAAKEEVEAAKKEVAAAEKKVEAAKKEVAAGPAQARSACS